MSLAPFEAGRKKVLYFSRGRGRGHAVTDIEIGRELSALRKDAQVLFVSYGTGARTFEERGIAVIDLGLPDANGIAVTTVLAGRLIGRLQPDLVVANEEFAALPAARIFGIPTVMITDFFGEPGKFSAESLWFADQVLFIDRKGVFAEPPSVAGKVRYLGPQIREFEYRRGHRTRARRELGIDPGAAVIAVFPGSWTEAMAPIADPLLAAFDGAKLRPKHLLWLAGRDADLIRRRVNGRNDITVIEADWRIDRLMVASDLAITKSTRTTVRELASLGIRTLSISHGLNPVDTDCIAALPSNRTLDISDLTARAIEKRLRDPLPPPVRSRSRSCAVELAKILDVPSESPRPK
jgi:UDP-N-acetylglucosamine:LPS N-acetylglucosamine transferase